MQQLLRPPLVRPDVGERAVIISKRAATTCVSSACVVSLLFIMTSSYRVRFVSS